MPRSARPTRCVARRVALIRADQVFPAHSQGVACTAQVFFHCGRIVPVPLGQVEAGPMALCSRRRDAR